MLDMVEARLGETLDIFVNPTLAYVFDLLDCDVF